MAGKKQRRTWQPPALMTERIEVRCSPEEKDAIYAAALIAGKAVSRFVVEATMEKVNKTTTKGGHHE